MNWDNPRRPLMVRLTLTEALEKAAAHARAGRIEEARRIYTAALRAHPDNARARRALADLDSQRDGTEHNSPSQAHERLLHLCRVGQFDEAVDEAERLVLAHPESFDIWNTLGGACMKSQRLDRAEDAFRRAIKISPEQPGAQYNLGLLLHRTGRLAEAKTSYAKALRRKPDHVQALNNMGNALADMSRPGEAEAAFRKALRYRPDYADAYSNLGRALKDLGRADEAIAAWERTLQLVPQHAAARSQKLRQQQELCDFSASAEFSEVRTTLGVTGDKVPPFALLSAEDDPARQRLRSERWARDIVATAPPARPPRPERRPKKLRVGYFSANFHDHPTLRLISGLLREHDRSRFDVFVYSFGRQKSGDLRKRLQQDVREFHDVEHLSPRQIADLARSHGMDIAIDLDGHTRAARAEIFANRPARIAISFLGFPGTMGAEFVDYLVADPVVIPDREREHYAERIIFLPETYQPNDDRQAIPDTIDSRSDHGLPETGVVLCCFNNSYKIGPREFDIWMRLLRTIDGSVLWLLRSNDRMEDNLAREAVQRGVDPARLVFAEKCVHDAHLARHRHADLFLDTFCYNAHTTASDALRAGLPVVTMAGRQFAARVGASLLTAAGLPDLIADTEDRYEALILDLARDPSKLVAIRERLARGVLTGSAFDTAQYTRQFEAALDMTFDLYVRGEDPRDIRIKGGNMRSQRAP